MAIREKLGLIWGLYLLKLFQESQDIPLGQESHQAPAGLDTF